MRPAYKQKLPVILLVSGLLILVIVISAVGLFLSNREYETVSASSLSSGGVSSTGSDGSPLPTAGGNSHAITITGEADDDFNAVLYTKRLYELKNQFAVGGFSSASELSPSVVVQYAFCHLYYQSLPDMPDDAGMVLRQVPPESIQKEVDSLFGETGVDIKKSDLYDADKNLFEMWQPRLRASVFADTVCKAGEDGRYELTVSFYDSSAKTTLTSAVVGVFEKQDGRYILKSMETK